MTRKHPFASYKAAKRSHPFLLHMLRRVVTLCLMVVAVSFATFSLLYVAPGNAATSILGVTEPTPETIRLIEEQFNLDKPFLTQYWLWARGAVQFDFGDSFKTTLPVGDELKRRLPTTLLLGFYAFVVTMVLGVTLGVVAALRRRSTVDRAIVAGAVVGLSTPVFVSGIVLLYVFGVVLPWFPIFGQGSGFTDQLWHLTLPALALAFHAFALVVKHTRSAMIGVLDQDYVTFARARGLSGRRVLFLYILRNSLIPIVTISGIVLIILIIGAVLVEVLFSLSGIGQLLVQSATTKDLPMLEGVAITIAVVVMVSNLLADFLYAAVDPRVRLGRTS